MNKKHEHKLDVQTTHTPTPWYVTTGPTNDDRGIETNSGHRIGWMTTHEDAAFIVRAVNSYEQNQKDIEHYKATLRGYQSYVNSYEEVLKNLKQAAVWLENVNGKKYDTTPMRQAISKAEGLL